MSYMFFDPTRVLFGNGQLNSLHTQKLPGKHALLMISNGTSAKRFGYLERTEKELEQAGCSWEIFDEVEPNPLTTTVMRAAQRARQAQCDFIVALGGGSVMDCAKAVAVMATNDGDVWDYAQGKCGGHKEITQTPLPLVAITTSAGTGSEVDAGGVITNPQTHEKIAYGCIDELFPVLAIVDPELTRSVPANFTAYQGFDALFHSTETYINKHANLMSDMVASEAITQVGSYLVRAVNTPDDAEAREHMSFANTISGYSMVSGGCTSEHALEHSLSAYHQELPHGAGLIMISRAYYQHFIDAHVCDERFCNMARMLGKRNANCAQDFIGALSDLQKACGVYDLKMSDYGITPDEFDAMADIALEAISGAFEVDRCRLTKQDCVKIYQQSYK